MALSVPTRTGSQPIIIIALLALWQCHSADYKFRNTIIALTLLYQYVQNESPGCLLATIPILAVFK